MSKKRKSLALEPCLNVRRPRLNLRPKRRKRTKKPLPSLLLKRPNAPVRKLKSRRNAKRKKPKLPQLKKEARSLQPRVKKS